LTTPWRPWWKLGEALHQEALGLRWSPVATYLDKILAAHRQAARQGGRDLDELLAEAQRQPPTRGFKAALRASPAIAVIAEVKRRSPSKGLLAPGLVPGLIAKAYAEAGASCLSVLTDQEFFAGSADDLAEARAAVQLPVLRKDFTVCAEDVCEARLMGADALLLIVGALSAAELAEFLDLSRRLGIDALVEVHNEAEAETALVAGADLIGVNQRDLVSFAVDTDRAVRVVANLPATVVRVAESGIRHHAEVRRLAEAGFDAVLVGEALVGAPDPGAALAALRGIR
jgi:indole-3-glycerol phosphate synthase